MLYNPTEDIGKPTDPSVYRELNIYANVSCPLNDTCSYIINLSEKSIFKQIFCDSILTKYNIGEEKKLPNDNNVNLYMIDYSYNQTYVSINFENITKSLSISEDSVYVKIPEHGKAKVYLEKDTSQYELIWADELENASFSFSKKDGFRDFIKIISSYTNKTAYATEIVRIYANMYWKQPIQGDSI
ncbi:MAG: hypothetical protein MJY99_07335 [Fibrobacter sp.]|nr:hypothetical protein [Fibrobacter sp.]